MGFFYWLKASFRKAAPAADPSRAGRNDEDELDPFNPFPDPIDLPLSDVIDLHTIPPRDVKRAVEEYLFQASTLGFPVVRIIHGKGIGVQRELVRTILARSQLVQDWTDAPPEAGGLGATIVHFKRSAGSTD